jgi:hypothetical protein
MDEKAKLLCVRPCGTSEMDEKAKLLCVRPCVTSEGVRSWDHFMSD